MWRALTSRHDSGHAAWSERWLSSNRHLAPSYYRRMIFSENRYPLLARVARRGHALARPVARIARRVSRRRQAVDEARQRARRDAARQHHLDDRKRVAPPHRAGERGDQLAAGRHALAMAAE